MFNYSKNNLEKRAFIGIVGYLGTSTGAYLVDEQTIGLKFTLIYVATFTAINLAETGVKEFLKRR